MHSDHYQALKALSRCTFYPGSWDKRFVRDMAALGPYDLLTPKQEQNIERLTYCYRKQLGRLGYGAPVAFIERARAEKAARAQEIRHPWLPERPQPETENPQLPLELL